MEFDCPSCNTVLFAEEGELSRGVIRRCPECQSKVQIGEVGEKAWGETDPSVKRQNAKNRTSVSQPYQRERSLKELYPEKSSQIELSLCVSIGAYLLGIFWPMITISKWVWIIPIGSNTASLASALFGFLSSGKLVLFGIIFIFSVAFPIAKLFVLIRLWVHPYARKRAHELAHRLAVVGKWSMLDVLVVGMLVAIVKIRDLVEVQVHLGIYFFALSVILTMLVTASIERLLDQS